MLRGTDNGRDIPIMAFEVTNGNVHELLMSHIGDRFCTCQTPLRYYSPRKRTTSD